MGDFLNVEEVLSQVDIKPDIMAIEFGCGSALFTVTLAKKLSKGKVYAVDIQEEKLSALKGRLAIERISNVSTIHCDLEVKNATGLPNNSLDLVLIPNVLFQSENKGDIILEGERILKSGGQLLIIDWLKKGPFSPSSGMVSPDEMKSIAKNQGLSFKKEFAAGDYHYALLFTK
jgi:ubiquinone/menaquinone biosynthesis C-methylase UbiE